MLKSFVLILPLFIFFSTPVKADNACNCRASLTTQEEIDNADSIFLARARKKIENGKWLIEFDILKAWKGFALRSNYATQPITKVDGCNFFFKNGEVYLVFSDAVNYKNELIVSRCSLTKEASRSLEELKLLGDAETDYTKLE